MWTRRVISALRDDLAALLRALAELQRKKLDLLNLLYTGEINKHHLLKSGLTDDLLKAVEYDSDVIARIGLVDVDAARTISAICRIVGIPFTDFEKEVLDREDVECAELRKVYADIKTRAGELYQERNSLIEKMEERASRLADDIKTLSKLKSLSIEKKDNSGTA